MIEIDIDKLKQWLKMKSNQNADTDWEWGQKFAFDWVIDILENHEYHNNMLLDLERNKENE